MATPRDPVADQKRKQQRAEDGRQAMSEYEAEQIAVREKTARLRALRLARDAELAAAAPAPAKGAKKKAAAKTAASGSRASKKPAEKLSSWLQTQRNQGRQS